MSNGQVVRRTSFEEIERRIAYLAPLFAYLHEHFMVPGRVVAAASARVGSPISSITLTQMKRGERLIPPWFVAACCRVLDRRVVDVMGAEWVERYGDDGTGGSETAPVGFPRTYGKSAAVVVVADVAAVGVAASSAESVNAA